jgi:hypothetical protein
LHGLTLSDYGEILRSHPVAVHDDDRAKSGS